MNEVNAGLEAVLNCYHEYIGCNKCALAENRPTKDIMGSFGSASADIMVITDAPSEEDFENGGLLTDEYGMFLMNLLEIIWDENDEKMDEIRNLEGEDYFNAVRERVSEHIFFCAMVACPKREGMKIGSTHVKKCIDRVHKLIYAIDPLIIIALGSVPGNTLTAASGQVANTRGAVYNCIVPSQFSSREVRYPCLITHHPRVVHMTGDTVLVEKGQGLTYECMQDFKTIFNIVKTHKELLCQ